MKRLISLIVVFAVVLSGFSVSIRIAEAEAEAEAEWDVFRLGRVFQKEVRSVLKRRFPELAKEHQLISYTFHGCQLDAGGFGFTFGKRTASSKSDIKEIAVTGTVVLKDHTVILKQFQVTITTWQDKVWTRKQVAKVVKIKGEFNLLKKSISKVVRNLLKNY